VSDFASAKLDEAMNLLNQKVNEKSKVVELNNKLQHHANEITNKVYASVKKTMQVVSIFKKLAYRQQKSSSIVSKVLAKCDAKCAAKCAAQCATKCTAKCSYDSDISKEDR
jgi:hypothetical protein